MMQLNVTGGNKTIAIKIISHIRIDKLPAEFENDKNVMLWALIPKIARAFYEEYYSSSVYDNVSYPELTTITISAIKVYDKELTRIEICYTTNHGDKLQSKYLNLLHDKDHKHYEYELVDDGLPKSNKPKSVARPPMTKPAPKTNSPKMSRPPVNQPPVKRPPPPSQPPRKLSFSDKHPTMRNALIGAGVAFGAVAITALVVAVAVFTGGIGVAVPLTLLATTAAIGGISTSSAIITAIGAAIGAAMIGAGIGVCVSWYKQRKQKASRQKQEQNEDIVLPVVPVAKRDDSSDDVDMNAILNDLKDLQNNLDQEEREYEKTNKVSPFNLFSQTAKPEPKSSALTLEKFKEDVLSQYFIKDSLNLRHQRIAKYSDPVMFTRFCDMVLSNKNTANYKRMDAAINTILNKEEYAHFDRELLKTTPIYQHLYPVRGFLNRIVNK